jgi:hypothetical protein
MTTPNSLDYKCDWRIGFNLNPLAKGTIGYLLYWTGCAGLSLPQDMTVWNPLDSSAQTVVVGSTIDCCGLLESFSFEGGAEDPIHIVSYVSKGVAASIRATLAQPLTNTKVKVGWYIIAFDDEAKAWYEAAFVKDATYVEALLDTSLGEVQMFIANEGTSVSDTLDLRVYRFEFQIIPQESKTANTEFSTGLTQHLVKAWGVAGA